MIELVADPVTIFDYNYARSYLTFAFGDDFDQIISGFELFLAHLSQRLIGELLGYSCKVLFDICVRG